MADKKEECGIFGIFGDPEAVQKTYFGLHSLQHRGQESAGIASSDGEAIHCFTGMGQVGRVFRAGRGILERIWSIQRFNIITSDSLSKAHDQHMDIFQCLCAGDPRRSEAAMRRHMRATTRELITRLRDHNDILHNAISSHPKKLSQSQ